MKKKFQPISISIFLMWALFLIEKGFNKKEIVGSKWTFKISMADCIPRTFLIEKVAWKSSLIGKNETRYAKMKFLSTGHASIWWDQVQVRRQRKGKGKYMRQDKMRSRLRDKFLPSD